MNEIDPGEVFEWGPSKGVEFEIIFAGVMASTLIAVSGVSPILDTLSAIGALSMLLLTMLRRMALENDFAVQEPILSSTLFLIFFISAFGLVYLSIFLIDLLSIFVGLNYWIALPLFLFTIPYITVGLYEFLYRDFMLWTAIQTYNKAGELSLGNYMVKSALFLSLVDKDGLPDEFEDVREQEDRSTIGIAEKIAVLAALLALVIILLLAVGTVAMLFLDQVLLQLIVVALAGLPLLGVLEFWFSRHGNARFGQLTSVKVRYGYFVVVASTAYLGSL
ncbi:hypothetical protein [Halovivax gelatinilyticus]|uniref:hypothetical protein n=1 Tax=Halovivax gelatinilyticus TaxID=2961597 RepID=UPI0020CA7C9B|nr:hypothetical protein [Halovivax gelatinilyticus]